MVSDGWPARPCFDDTRSAQHRIWIASEIVQLRQDPFDVGARRDAFGDHSVCYIFERHRGDQLGVATHSRVLNDAQVDVLEPGLGQKLRQAQTYVGVTVAAPKRLRVELDVALDSRTFGLRK
jgi:hypothetical protein